MNNVVTLTQSAIEHLNDTLGQQPDALGIRLGIKDSGCSGYAYVVDYATEQQASDRVIEVNGIRLYIAADHIPAFQGTEVDYKREGLNAHLSFNNPNATNACGCGESFQLKNQEKAD